MSITVDLDTRSRALECRYLEKASHMLTANVRRVVSGRAVSSGRRRPCPHPGGGEISFSRWDAGVGVVVVVAGRERSGSDAGRVPVISRRLHAAFSMRLGR